MSLVTVVSLIWTERKRIAFIVGIVTALSIVISLLLPNYYKSTATLLPETEKSKLGSFGGFSDLASLVGLSGGEGSFVKLYPKIILSEAVLKNVIYAKYYSEKKRDSVDLVQFWDIGGDSPLSVYERALRALRGELDIAMDLKTNIVSISIETREARMSSDIVNKITEELDRFIRTRRTTNASEQRKWIEARLSEVKNDLGGSENSLKEFREKNRRVVDSPELLLEQERLIREVQINSALYTELKKQFELVKIEEIKNIPVVTVMDPGRPTEFKERPKRSIIVITTFVLSFLGAAMYVIFGERYPDELAQILAFVRTRFSRT